MQPLEGTTLDRGLLSSVPLKPHLANFSSSSFYRSDALNLQQTGMWLAVRNSENEKTIGFELYGMRDTEPRIPKGLLGYIGYKLIDFLLEAFDIMHDSNSISETSRCKN